jgi:hypothetical protein
MQVVMRGHVQNKCVPHMFLAAHRAAELHAKKLKDNIETDIKEISLMTTWNGSNLINM